MNLISLIYNSRNSKSQIDHSPAAGFRLIYNTEQQDDAKRKLIRWRVGALFMEAGTGKTRVTVELVNSCEDVDHVIWIGPLRTIKAEKGSVVEEIGKWGEF